MAVGPQENACIPRCPHSWPEFAVKITVRSKGSDAQVRASSMNVESPGPRSDAHAHHPERGVMTTMGASEGSVPINVASTLQAVAPGVRVAAHTPVAVALDSTAWISSGTASDGSCSTGGPNGPCTSSPRVLAWTVSSDEKFGALPSARPFTDLATSNPATISWWAPGSARAAVSLGESLASFASSTSTTPIGQFEPAHPSCPQTPNRSV